MDVVAFQLRVDSSTKLPAYSDKAILPPSVLSQIIDIIPESQLPHPLIFEITCGSRTTYIGVKEFSAPEEDTAYLPSSVLTKLDVQDQKEVTFKLRTDIPKANSLRIRPTQLYTNITNWKYFLENKLNQFYTTLTSKESLVIEDEALRYELLIEEINGESAKSVTACIIDTDIVLDVVPINDKLAHDQIKEFDSNPHNNIVEIETELQAEGLKSFLDPKFVPAIYKIDLSKYKHDFQISLNSSTLYNVDLIVGMDKFINLESFKWTTMSQDFDVENGTQECKKVIVNMKDDEITNKLHRAAEQGEDDDYDEIDKWIYIIAFSWNTPSDIKLVVGDVKEKHDIEEDTVTDDSKPCVNCHKHISLAKIILHETFCLRNNIKCEVCGQVNSKKTNHWHCDQCSFYTNDALIQQKHIQLYHQGPYKCGQCHTGNYSTFIDLVTQHKGDCPQKLHECRFCHLIVPQEESTYQDKFANLTHHENQCGNKTSECYKCNKPIRTKDLKKHMKMHDLDKQSFRDFNKITFRRCSNVNCIKLLGPHTNNELELCDLCFGPIYVNQHDPTHIKLQQRIERKYMLQLTKGCNNSWCNNPYCQSSNSESVKKPFKELLQILTTKLLPAIHQPPLPINSKLNLLGPNRIWFCVNESITKKKLWLDMLQEETSHDTSLLHKSLNECHTLSEVTEWLQQHS